MGTFRIEIQAVGAHGQDREKKMEKSLISQLAEKQRRMRLLNSV